MIHISPVKQLNFMANRVLAYGDLACNSQEVLEQVTGVRDFKNWHIIWMKLGEKAEKEKRYLHAANYFRMAEFFMKKTDEGKIDIYTRCVNDFYRGFDEELHLDYERFSVPFGKGFLNTIRLSSNQRKASLLVCGGYDLSGITDRLKAHYLLLAGEADHYIPQNQYYRLKNAIHHAASLQCHMYTAEEGGEQHCQVGNHMLAVQEMLDWLNHLTA